jgi:alpha-glucosidase
LASQYGKGLEWWKTAVFYQIYPLSFQDTNGDGMGDLRGIEQRLDHLSWLGINAVWLSPIQPSPMADWTYDISDFTEIEPTFGTIEDFDRLVEALHARGIRVILDFVPNHTSDRHAWFQESRSWRDSPKRDWYVWQEPGPDGGPPNSWLSRFGGSAWAWDERTGQYYYHAFLEEQPDLNWRNPEVRAAMTDVLRFWMRRGADGFRFDASAVLIEDALLRDEPLNPDFDDDTPPPEKYLRVFTDDRPETLGYLSELRRVVDEFPDRVILGEIQGATDRVPRFFGEPDSPRLHLPLNFALLDTPWDARALDAAIDKYLNVLPPGSWGDWVLGSHDRRRIASRVGPAQARIAAMLLFTLPGTPIFFAGDEIGMPDVPVARWQVKDPFERLAPGYGLNRDPERAPMRWEPGPKAGFTTGEPWLPIGEDVEASNVASQRENPCSLLCLYRQLIRLRASEPALHCGRFRPMRGRGDVLLFSRVSGDDEIAVALNIGGAAAEAETGASAVVLSTCLERDGEPVKGTVDLRPDEGVIVRRTG